MSLSVLLSEVQQQAAEDLQQAATLPGAVCFRFDAAQEAGGAQVPDVRCGG